MPGWPIAFQTNFLIYERMMSIIIESLFSSDKTNRRPCSGSVLCSNKHCKFEPVRIDEYKKDFYLFTFDSSLAFIPLLLETRVATGVNLYVEWMIFLFERKASFYSADEYLDWYRKLHIPVHQIPCVMRQGPVFTRDKRCATIRTIMISAVVIWKRPLYETLICFVNFFMNK